MIKKGSNQAMPNRKKKIPNILCLITIYENMIDSYIFPLVAETMVHHNCPLLCSWFSPPLRHHKQRNPVVRICPPEHQTLFPGKTQDSLHYKKPIVNFSLLRFQYQELEVVGWNKGWESCNGSSWVIEAGKSTLSVLCPFVFSLSLSPYLDLLPVEPSSWNRVLCWVLQGQKFKDYIIQNLNFLFRRNLVPRFNGQRLLSWYSSFKKSVVHLDLEFLLREHHDSWLKVGLFNKFHLAIALLVPISFFPCYFPLWSLKHDLCRGLYLGG